MARSQTFALYLRSFVFGVEDSLVSTVGLLSGMAVAGAAQQTIVLSGIILICVEAFSMGVGDTLSEHQAEKYAARREVPFHQSLVAGMVMFISYLCAGLVPLWPYLVLAPERAFPTSLISTLVALLLLGIISARLSGTRALRNVVEMLTIGGLAVLIGIAVGVLIDGGLIGTLSSVG